MSISLWIGGEPVAKGRPRISSFGGKARAYTPAATRKAEERIASLWQGECIEQGVPIMVTVSAYHERPKSHRLVSGPLSKAGVASVFPTKRPDLDNIVKLVLDGLNGVAYHDDAQIVNLIAERRWAALGEEPGVQVVVQRVRPTPTA